MSNVIEYPAGRVHKRYAANIPRYAEQTVIVRDSGHYSEVGETPSLRPHPGVVMLGLITLWAFWCAGAR